MEHDTFKWDTLSAKSLELYQRCLISAPDHKFHIWKRSNTGWNRGRYSALKSMWVSRRKSQRLSSWCTYDWARLSLPMNPHMWDLIISSLILLFYSSANLHRYFRELIYHEFACNFQETKTARWTKVYLERSETERDCWDHQWITMENIGLHAYESFRSRT